MGRSNIRIFSNISLEQVVKSDNLKAQISDIYEAMNSPAYQEKDNIISDVSLNQVALHMDGLQGCSIAGDSREKMWGLVRRGEGYAIACKCKNTGCPHFKSCRADLKE